MDLGDILCTEKMNISFDYLYRDAGNYKLFDSVIFTNKNKLSTCAIDLAIHGNLFQGLYFIPKSWRLRKLKFPEFKSELDHPWHEYLGLTETKDYANDLRDIKEFLSEVNSRHQNQEFVQEFLDGDDFDDFHHS